MSFHMYNIKYNIHTTALYPQKLFLCPNGRRILTLAHYSNYGLQSRNILD